MIVLSFLGGSSLKNSTLGSAVKNVGFEHVFLASAIIQINDKNGKPIKARALLDSGSQINLMTEQMHNKLGLKYNRTSMKVAGIEKVVTESSKRSVISIKSAVSSFEAELEVFILKKITSCQPEQEIDIGGWNISENITLADGKFNIPAKIDIIIGGELFFKLMTNGMKSLGENLPDIQNTVFGWVVTVKLLGLYQNKAFVGVST